MKTYRFGTVTKRYFAVNYRNGKLQMPALQPTLLVSRISLRYLIYIYVAVPELLRVSSCLIATIASKDPTSLGATSLYRKPFEFPLESNFVPNMKGLIIALACLISASQGASAPSPEAASVSVLERGAEHNVSQPGLTTQGTATNREL